MFILPNNDIQYLKQLLYDENHQLRILPYAELAGVPQEHLSQFCIEEGVYCVPTQELVAFLRHEIGGETAIEIGAGNGSIARALGIPATDSMMQADPQVQRLYAELRQAPVQYGSNVERYDADAAIAEYRPHTVVAAWFTHRFEPNEAWRGGNVFGGDEKQMLRRVRRYIFVGNAEAHKNKPLLEEPHRTVQAEWLLSRSMRRAANVVWIWER